MYGRHGSSSETEVNSISAGQWLLLFAGVFFFSSAFYLQKVALPAFEKQPPIAWNLTSLKWLSEIELAFEEKDLPPEPQVTIPAPIVSPSVQKSIKNHPAKNRRKHPSRLFAKGFSRKADLGKVAPLDQVTLTAAAPKSEVTPEEPQVDATEQGKLVQMHRFLTARLMIALNAPFVQTAFVQPDTQLQNDVKEIPQSQTVATVNTHRSLKQVDTHPAMLRPTRALKKSSAPSQSVSVSAPQVVALTPPSVSSKKAERKIASFGKIAYEPASEPAEEKIKVESAVKAAQEWNERIPESFKTLVNQPTQYVEDREVAKLDQMKSDMNDLYYRSLGDSLASVQGGKPSLLALNTQTPSVDSSVPVTSADLAPAQENGYSVQASGYSKSEAVVVSTHPVQVVQPPVNTQLPASPVTPPAPVPTPIQEVEEPTPTPPHMAAIAEEDSTQYVEAFDPSRSSLVVATEMISQESFNLEGTSKRGWELSTSADHWPTLRWADSSTHSNEFVPIMHLNTVRSFANARLGGNIQEAGAGIVFGKVPAGWQVGFSPEELLGVKSPAFIDAQGSTIAPDNTEEERYFVFLNVNPGMRRIYLNSVKGEGSGGLILPVLAGTSTYLDLTKVSSHQVLSGTLYDASRNSDEQMWPLSGSTIRVLGQASGTAITDSNGYFHLENLVTVSSYPLYIESDKVVETDEGPKRLGRTHRYRVLPEKMQDLMLFRVGKRQVRDWEGQLEGGVSKLSGVVVAALPQMVADNPDLLLEPSVRSIPSSGNLVPETYTLSAEGDLKVRTPLQYEETRFVGVQVPEGPVVTQVTDRGQKVVWSELLYSSPEVVNMVGPY